MTAPARSWWPAILALGVGFTILNLVELALVDGGWPQIVGVVIGCALVAFDPLGAQVALASTRTGISSGCGSSSG